MQFKNELFLPKYFCQHSFWEWFKVIVDERWNFGEVFGGRDQLNHISQ